MKTAQLLATLLLTFVLIISCQEEDLITGKVSSSPVISPTTGGGHSQDADGDGVPDSEDNCPNDYAYNDMNKDGCEDAGFTIMYKTSFSSIGRRPKPCELPRNCQEILQLKLGEILIGLAPEAVLKSADVTVYNANKEMVGSSTEAHGGSITFGKGGALLDVGLSDAQYKKETLMVMVKASFVVDGEEMPAETAFEWGPDDF